MNASFKIIAFIIAFKFDISIFSNVKKAWLLQVQISIPSIWTVSF